MYNTEPFRTEQTKVSIDSNIVVIRYNSNIYIENYYEFKCDTLKDLTKHIFIVITRASKVQYFVPFNVKILF